MLMTYVGLTFLEPKIVQYFVEKDPYPNLTFGVVVRIPLIKRPRHTSQLHSAIMLSKLFDLEDYAGTYRETRNAYLKAANQLKLATGPYKAARDAYVAATATYTKSLYE